MIETTENMGHNWLRCLHSTQDIIDATVWDASNVPDNTPWDWEGAPHFDLNALAQSEMERAIKELLDGLI